MLVTIGTQTQTERRAGRGMTSYLLFFRRCSAAQMDRSDGGFLEELDRCREHHDPDIHASNTSGSPQSPLPAETGDNSRVQFCPRHRWILPEPDQPGSAVLLLWTTSRRRIRVQVQRWSETLDRSCSFLLCSSLEQNTEPQDLTPASIFSTPSSGDQRPGRMRENQLTPRSTMVHQRFPLQRPNCPNLIILSGLVKSSRRMVKKKTPAKTFTCSKHSGYFCLNVCEVLDKRHLMAKLISKTIIFC